MAMACSLHGDCPLDEEIIVLEAIYINELEVKRDDHGHVCDIRLVLHPATADEADLQYVRITLVIKLPIPYPNELPEIVIENSRGLGDSQISCLSKALNFHAETCRGWPMLHELIETAKDTLTAGNIPSCPCAICLDNFCEGDDIYKTTCYHYYHPECLADYVNFWRHGSENDLTKRKTSSDDRRRVACPICREPMNVDDLPGHTGKRAPTFGEDMYVPDPYMKALQEKMNKLYLKQKQKGGIIDVEAEKNKYLIQNGTVVLPAMTMRNGGSISTKTKSSLQSTPRPSQSHNSDSQARRQYPPNPRSQKRREEVDTRADEYKKSCKRQQENVSGQSRNHHHNKRVVATSAAGSFSETESSSHTASTSRADAGPPSNVTSYRDEAEPTSEESFRAPSKPTSDKPSVSTEPKPTSSMALSCNEPNPTSDVALSCNEPGPTSGVTSRCESKPTSSIATSSAEPEPIFAVQNGYDGGSNSDVFHYREPEVHEIRNLRNRNQCSNSSTNSFSKRFDNRHDFHSKEHRNRRSLGDDQKSRVLENCTTEQGRAPAPQYADRHERQVNDVSSQRSVRRLEQQLYSPPRSDRNMGSVPKQEAEGRRNNRRHPSADTNTVAYPRERTMSGCSQENGPLPYSVRGRGSFSYGRGAHQTGNVGQRGKARYPSSGHVQRS